MAVKPKTGGGFLRIAQGDLLWSTCGEEKAKAVVPASPPAVTVTQGRGSAFCSITQAQLVGSAFFCDFSWSKAGTTDGLYDLAEGTVSLGFAAVVGGPETYRFWYVSGTQNASGSPHFVASYYDKSWGSYIRVQVTAKDTRLGGDEGMKVQVESVLIGFEPLKY